MAENTRDVTVTFDDGTSHKYAGVPINVSPDDVEQRALKDFGGKKITNIDGGSKPSPVKTATKQERKPTKDQALPGFTSSGEDAYVDPMGGVYSLDAPGAKAGATLLAGAAGTLKPLAGAAQLAGLNAPSKKLDELSKATGDIGGTSAKVAEFAGEVASPVGVKIGDAITKGSQVLSPLVRGTLSGAGVGFAQGMLTPSSQEDKSYADMLQNKARESLISGLIGGGVGHSIDLLHLKDWTIGKLLGRSFGQTMESKAASVAVEKALNVQGEVVSPKLGQEAVQKAHTEIKAGFEKATNTKIPDNVDPVKFVYQKAGSSINEIQATGESFVKSSFFGRAASVEGKTSRAQEETYKKLFVDAKGNPLPGQNVIDNIYAFKYGEGLPDKVTQASRNARFAEGEKIEKEFNGWLMQSQEKMGLPKQPWQANARKAAEQVHIANAKDALPTMFKDVVTFAGGKQKGELSKAANVLDKEIWNLSKTPEGQSAFLKQLAGNIKEFPLESRGVLWNNIKDNVKTNMIKNPATFQEVSDIMTTAVTSKDVDRAVRLLERSASSAYKQASTRSERD